MHATTGQILSTLSSWLESRRVEYSKLESLAGDVSPRRYVRIVLPGREARVAAIYPAEQREAGERFLRSGALLAASRVRVPRVLEWDADAGIMLLTDAGPRSVYEEVSRGRPPGPYRRRAVGILERMTQLDARNVEDLNPPLDGPMMRREIEQSRALVLEPRGLLGMRGELEGPLLALCDRLAAARRHPCHRDFMARNLLLDAAGELTVIDHQDLRMGPPWYDLASLLNDSLYADPIQEERLLGLAGVADGQREDYHRAAAQRALKIVGTFEAFARRGHPHHVPLINPSLRAARRHLACLPEAAAALAGLHGVWDRELENGAA